MKTFAQKVYAVVKTIPPGRTLTYQAVAKLAGSPRAARAVGNVLNRNPDPSTIPCHRVIRSNGAIGGYRWGQQKKKRLLKAEGFVKFTA